MNEIQEFFATYPPNVQDLALALRKLVSSTIPDAVETLDRSARIVGYGFGNTYANTICVIIPSQKGVKLGIARGADLPDPKGLLEGAGKVHRHIAFAEKADLRKSGIKPLLRTAVAAWRVRSAK